MAATGAIPSWRGAGPRRRRRGPQRLLLDLAALERLTSRPERPGLVALERRVGSELAERLLAAAHRRPAPADGSAPGRERPQPGGAVAQAQAEVDGPSLETPLTCVLADDHPIVGEALANVLAAGGVEVLAVARSGLEALRTIERTRSTVALVDVRLPDVDGVEVARRAAERAPETAVILYTGAEDAFLGGALASGARGFLLKDAPVGDVVRAVRAVADGGMFVDARIAARLAGLSEQRRLTTREREVLHLLARGLTDRAIAAELAISHETVRSHVRRTMQKLGAATRTQAVATALRERMIA